MEASLFSPTGLEPIYIQRVTAKRPLMSGQ
jgi:hypothetical protein